MVEVRAPAEWNAMVSSLQLARDGDVETEADRNMLVFALAEAGSLVLTEEQMSRFLSEAFYAYCAKAAKIRLNGWFYAWFDEMSGTLRCSACSVVRAIELPFSCRLNIVDSPNEIAHAAARSTYISGISTAEFQSTEEGNEQDGDLEFVLTVFARQMIGPV